MIIRKIRQERIRKKKRILLGSIGGLILIGLGVMFIQRQQNKPIVVKEIQETQDPIVAIGQHITLSGKIIAENQFPLYTHSIAIDEDRKMGLRSISLNLNNYLNENIEIEGTIENIEKNLPIVQVQKIKKRDENMILWKNTYLFTDSLLFLDFTEQNELSISKSGNYIDIIYNGAPLINIEYFPCSKVTDAQNCEKLILDYKYSEKENFISYLGYTFYRYGDKDRITFNSNILGYIFRVENDEDILNLSHMIDFVNQKFIETKKQEDINQHCKSLLTGKTINDIENIKITHKPPVNMLITTKLTATDGQEIFCNNNINLRDQMKIEETNIIE